MSVVTRCVSERELDGCPLPAEVVISTDSFPISIAFLLMASSRLMVGASFLKTTPNLQHYPARRSRAIDAPPVRAGIARQLQVKTLVTGDLFMIESLEQRRLLA